MNRFGLNMIIRTVRVNPTIRSTVPYRWNSTQTTTNQSSSLTAAVTGGLTVLLGGLAWYQISGTRRVVGTVQTGVKQAEEFKKVLKDNIDDPAKTIKYLRSTSEALFPASAPFVGKIFQQLEEISKEHGDDVKKVFQETYKDFEKLVKEGNLDFQTATKALDIVQTRVKEIQELVGDIGGDAYEKLISDNPGLGEKISGQYNDLKEIVEKAKEKKPEVEKLVKETGSELVEIFKDGDVSSESTKRAQSLLKKKLEEAKKLVEDTTKETKKKEKH